MQTKFFKSLMVCGCATALLGGAVAQGATVVTPDGLGNTNGVSRDPGPFGFGGSDGTDGSRAQVVYSSDFFSSVGGPVQISSFSLRQHAGGLVAARSRSFSDSVIQLSTTAASENNLSTTFADNIGNDATTVFTGGLDFSSNNTDPQPQDFEFTVNFDTPFVFDPSQGNLLLDVQVPTDATISGRQGFSSLFDSVNNADDGTFSVGDINNGDATTGTSKASPVTQFTFTAANGGGGTAVPTPTAAAAGLVLLGGMFVRRRRRRAA